MKTRSALALLAMACLALAACSPAATASPAASSPAAASGGAGTSVAVTLSEWAVANQPASVPAGSVTFTATNDGPDDVHELVVIMTDLALTDLPTDETGKVDESGEGIEIMGEIEEFAVGTTEEMTLDLEPGAYVLICNIYDETEQEAHYQEGMRSALTVE